MFFQTPLRAFRSFRPTALIAQRTRCAQSVSAFSSASSFPKSPDRTLQLTIYGATNCSACSAARFTVQRVVKHVLERRRNATMQPVVEAGHDHRDNKDCGLKHEKESAEYLTDNVCKVEEGENLEKFIVSHSGVIIEICYVNISTLPQLIERYKEAVPVVCLNNVEVTRLRVDGRKLGKAPEDLLEDVATKH